VEPKSPVGSILACWMAVAAMVALSLAALWFGVLAA
jgi:hypothetical protein